MGGIVGGLLFFGLTVYMGRQSVAPVPRHIGEPPAFMGGQTVRFPSQSGSKISGWLSKSPEGNGCVLLLHAIRADRRSMSERALFLRKRGYHTLCIDFQAHGESPGNFISLGHFEAMDAAAGVAFLRDSFPTLPVAVVGTSLGGASALLADYLNPPEAMVVEAVFADVDTAIANRFDMRLGSVGRLLSPLLTLQIRPFLGFDAATLSPVLAATRISQPLFVVYGELDRHACPPEAKAIYNALQGPKEIWGIAGAAHIDLHRFAGSEYEHRVGDFIATHFKRGAAEK